MNTAGLICAECRSYTPPTGQDPGDCSLQEGWPVFPKPGDTCANFKPRPQYVEIPETGIGDLSDGYHTCNGLYYQRMVLFMTLVKVFKDRAWKSQRHEDGELCFGGGWFIVGIDTPDGSYTYHYEMKDWYAFDCEELPVAKHWDGHTEEDVTRLLSLPVPVKEEWISTKEQLPPIGGTVLTVDKFKHVSDRMLKKYRNGEIYFTPSGLHPTRDVLYWLPLSKRLSELIEGR